MAAKLTAGQRKALQIVADAPEGTAVYEKTRHSGVMPHATAAHKLLWLGLVELVAFPNADMREPGKPFYYDCYYRITDAGREALGGTKAAAKTYRSDDPKVFVPNRVLNALKATTWGRGATKSDAEEEAYACLFGGAERTAQGARVMVTPAALRLFRDTAEASLRSSDRHEVTAARRFLDQAA